MSDQQATAKRPTKSSKQGERKRRFFYIQGAYNIVVRLLTAFVIQEEVAAVKELMHNSSLSAEERCPVLYKKYTQLVQDHKLQERKIAEALRKQLEVCELVVWQICEW